MTLSTLPTVFHTHTLTYRWVDQAVLFPKDMGEILIKIKILWKFPLLKLLSILVHAILLISHIFVWKISHIFCGRVAWDEVICSKWKKIHLTFTASGNWSSLTLYKGLWKLKSTWSFSHVSDIFYVISVVISVFDVRSIFLQNQFSCTWVFVWCL